MWVALVSLLVPTCISVAWGKLGMHGNMVKDVPIPEVNSSICTMVAVPLGIRVFIFVSLVVVVQSTWAIGVCNSGLLLVLRYVPRRLLFLI